MARYAVQHGYRTQSLGPWEPGQVIDLDDALAAHVEADSPGCLVPADVAAEDPPRDGAAGDEGTGALSPAEPPPADPPAAPSDEEVAAAVTALLVGGVGPEAGDEGTGAEQPPAGQAQVKRAKRRGSDDREDAASSAGAMSKADHPTKPKDA